jgi:colanic acid/amylovoran biosynthesis glycosyltransferase
VGRLTPAKGQLLLVQACAVLVAEGLDFELTIVGDGPDRARLEAATLAGHLGGRLHFTGALNQTEVQAALSQADAFVLPSLAEGIPVVLMEAMASGVPCISCPVNGIPELIEHDRTGLLATPGDVAALATQLRRMIEQPDLRARLAQAGRAQVEQAFDLQRNVAQLSRIFLGLPSVTAPATSAPKDAPHGLA